MDQIAGYILTGGKNRRMEGRKKLLLQYKEKTFLEWIMEAMDILPLVYLSVDDSESWEKRIAEAFPPDHSLWDELSPDLHLVEDIYKEAGPLSGIVSGLSQCSEDALFVTCCDMPFIREEHIRRIVREYDSKPSIIVADDGERIHPLFGIYPRSALEVLKRRLEAGQRKMMDAIEEAGFRTVAIDAEALDNINTVQQWETLYQMGED